MQICRAASCCIAVLMVCALQGCGPKARDTASVRGKVTYAGRPVTTGDVIFYPVEGRPGRGKIGRDGSYSLSTFTPEDGAIVGKHKVTVIAIKNREELVNKFKNAQRSPQSLQQFILEQDKQRLVPKKYDSKETTTIEKQVVPGSNILDIEIDAE